MPYIGIDGDKAFALLYTDSGDASVVIRMQNPVEQYSANQDGYYEFHGLMNNVIKLLGAGYTVQKQDIFSKKKYQNPINTEGVNELNTEDYLESRYHQHFENRIYTTITTNLVITQNALRGFFNHDAKQIGRAHVWTPVTP